MFAIVSKPECDDFARSVERILEEVGGDEKTAERLGIPVAKNPDAVFAVGGDGTLLLAERLYPHVPKLSIGCGRLSFLSSLEARQIKHGLAKFLEGDYSLEERSKVKCGRGEALNEIAVLSSHLGKMVELNVSIDGKPAESFRGDGILVATPTGSTAYALSAGGPILAPHVEAFAIVPVSPFRLASRPIVVSDSSKIRVTAKGEALVSMDGFPAGRLGVGEHIEIEKGEKTEMIDIGGGNFYSKLRRL